MPKVLLDQNTIQKKVREMGAAITRDYQGLPLTCVGILKGSIIFFSDLIRNIDLPLKVDFLGASSYGMGTTSSGVVQITLDLTQPIEGKNILLIEDIVDTGLTIDYLMENLRLRNPASVKLCSLLHKPVRLQKKVPIDYLGFEIEDRFVVGYGLDAGEFYRNLPYVGYFEEK